MFVCVFVCVCLCVCVSEGAFNKKALTFSPTAESFGVSAQIGSGVVRGGPEVRFHEGSTRVPPDPTKFYEGSTRVPHSSARAAGWCEH